MKGKHGRTNAFLYFCRRAKTMGYFNYYEINDFLIIYLYYPQSK